MKSNVKILMCAFAVVPFAVAAVLLCTSGQNAPVKYKLGLLDWTEMEKITGGGEAAEGCISEPIDCKGSPFSFSVDCSGCVAVNDGSSPDGLLIGTREEGNSLTCGSSNKSYNYTNSVNCTAISTCVYTQSPAHYSCYLGNLCSPNGTPCPGEVCYEKSGNPPTQWTAKEIGECLDP